MHHAYSFVHVPGVCFAHVPGVCVCVRACVCCLCVCVSRERTLNNAIVSI